MLTKTFFDHLLQLDQALFQLERYTIPRLDKAELTQIIHDSTRTEIITLILSELPSEYHQDFLARFSNDPGDPQLLIFLDNHTSGRTTKLISARAKKIQSEILSEIKRASKVKHD